MLYKTGSCNGVGAALTGGIIAVARTDGAREPRRYDARFAAYGSVGTLLGVVRQHVFSSKRERSDTQCNDDPVEWRQRDPRV